MSREPSPPDDQPEGGPDPFWQATGLRGGRAITFRWQDCRWSSEDARWLDIYLFELRVLLADLSSASDPTLPEMTLPPDVGLWADAAEQAARIVLGHHVVIDTNFGSGVWVEGRVY